MSRQDRAEPAPGRLSLAVEALLVFLVLFVPLQGSLAQAKLTIFLARDLDRAGLLAAGRPILFGPEASGGGHLPGGFYYFLLALPLKLGLGWKGVWELSAALAAAAFSALWLFARRRLGVFPACYVLLCAGFFDFGALAYAYNASFLPFFAAAALIFLCGAFDAESGRRGLAWALFALACGLGLQFHLTFGLLLAAGAACQLAAPALGLKRLPRREFAAGLLVLGLVLLPFGAWAAGAFRSGQTVLPFTDAHDLRLADVLAGVAANGIEGKLRVPTGFLVRRSLALLPLEAVVPLLALRLARGPRGTAEDEPRFAAACVKVLAVASAATIFPYLLALALSPPRYSLIPRMSLDLLACAALARGEPRLRRPAFYAAAIGGLCALAAARHALFWPEAFDARALLAGAAFPLAAGAALALRLRGAAGRGAAAAGRGEALALAFAALVLPPFVALNVRAAAVYDAHGSFPAAADLAALSRAVYARTGWSYEEARLRLFYVNARYTVTPAYVYRGVAAEGRGAAAPDGLDRVDGYFAALPERAPEAAELLRSSSPADWLLSQGLAATPAEALRSGGLRLGRASAAGRFVLIPYEVQDAGRWPARFHNSSEGYSRTAPPPPPAPGPGESVYRLTFNDCPRRWPWCDVDADVRLRPDGGGRWSVDVALSGEPLSQACEGINLAWLETLARPYFSATCGGRERRVLLADSVGMVPDGYRYMNKSLLAPYERSFRVDCGARVDRIAVGYESAAAYANASRVSAPLPARELSARGPAR